MSGSEVFAADKGKGSMKTVIVKTFFVLVGVALIVPFGATALLAGTRLFAATENMTSDIVLVALAAAGALYSVVNNRERKMGESSSFRLRLSVRNVSGARS